MHQKPLVWFLKCKLFFIWSKRIYKLISLLSLLADLIQTLNIRHCLKICVIFGCLSSFSAKLVGGQRVCWFLGAKCRDQDRVLLADKSVKLFAPDHRIVIRRKGTFALNICRKFEEYILLVKNKLI